MARAFMQMAEAAMAEARTVTPAEDTFVVDRESRGMSTYLDFYDLEADPFEQGLDSDQIYVAQGYREALTILQYAIKSRKGFAAFYGKRGIGKTTLIRHVEQNADAHTRVLALSEGNIPYHCLLKKILEKAGLPLKRESKGSMLHELYLYLIRSLADGLNLVLILDDAHLLHTDVLEDLRLLSNLETSRSKLIQIIFVGEPKLEGILSADSMRQLRQRISITHHIAPMTREESMEYVIRRLRRSDGGVFSVFTQEALSLITTCAAGIPERLNRLCHNSLVEGYIRNERPVTGIVVRAVRDEAEFKTFQTQVAPVKRPARLADRFRGDRLVPDLARVRDSLSSALSSALASARWSPDRFRGAGLIPSMDRSRHALTAALASVILLLALVQLPSVDLSVPTISGQSHDMAQSTPAFETPFMADSAPGGHANGARHYSRDSFSPVKTMPIPKDATLTSLAVIHYGHSSPMLLNLILEMNPEIADIDRIFQGQTIRLPEITDASAILAISENSFKIQIGTVTRRREIRDLQQALQLKDEDVEIVSRRVSPSQWWYRVLVGPYPSREDCLAALRHLKGKANFTQAEGETRRESPLKALPVHPPDLFAGQPTGPAETLLATFQ